MNTTLKISTLGRRAQFVILFSSSRHSKPQQAASHVRKYATQYGISHLAVDFDVVR